MSIYAVNRACRQLLHDQAFRQAMVADPASALAPLDLTEAERAALLAGEVGELHLMGANAFLMGYLVRYAIGGMTLQTFNTRMRAVADRASGGQG
jgi:hypothetical protein